ncbi:hypothetical protein Bbelb_340980 [Branchiostoma belcheri]|nr:hypothetical protein Bbelb_340980 [Branchiostoma belcheri]
MTTFANVGQQASQKDVTVSPHFSRTRNTTIIGRSRAGIPRLNREIPSLVGTFIFLLEIPEQILKGEPRYPDPDSRRRIRRPGSGPDSLRKSRSPTGRKLLPCLYTRAAPRPRIWRSKGRDPARGQITGGSEDPGPESHRKIGRSEIASVPLHAGLHRDRDELAARRDPPDGVRTKSCNIYPTGVKIPADLSALMR